MRCTRCGKCLKRLPVCWAFEGAHHGLHPFDREKTAYAYVRAYSGGGYGHLILYVRLPSLADSYPHSAVELCLWSQCSEPRDTSEPEPFYSIELLAIPFGSGLSQFNCERSARELARVSKAIAKIDRLAGAPAVLLEDRIMRTLTACKVAHVYCPRDPQGVNPRDTSTIPDMPHYTPENFETLHSHIAYLKRQVLKGCGWFREAA